MLSFTGRRFSRTIERNQGNVFNWEGAVGIAGLWADYESEEEPIASCTMLTCDANGLVMKHRSGRMRMPVLLTRETAAMWLDPDRQKPSDFKDVFEPYSADLMRVIEVES